MFLVHNGSDNTISIPGGYAHDNENYVECGLRVVRKKERNPLHEGSLKGIGSSLGMQSYKGGWISTLGGTSS